MFKFAPGIFRAAAVGISACLRASRSLQPLGLTVAIALSRLPPFVGRLRPLRAPLPVSVPAFPVAFGYEYYSVPAQRQHYLEKHSAY